MLLPIGNDKKSILNKMVLIYIPNRKNPKRICSDFLCFISRQIWGKHSHDRYKMVNIII